MNGGIDSLVAQKTDAYRGNPQKLAQRYQQNQQLIDLLALQKIKSEKEAAVRQMQMEMEQQPQTIAQQREAEVMGLTKNELAKQIGGVAQQKQAQQQKNLQRVAQSGIAGANPQNQIQFAGGGIVNFADGGRVLSDDELRKLGYTREQWRQLTPEAREKLEATIPKSPTASIKTSESLGEIQARAAKEQAQRAQALHYQQEADAMNARVAGMYAQNEADARRNAAIAESEAVTRQRHYDKTMADISERVALGEQRAAANEAALAHKRANPEARMRQYIDEGNSMGVVPPTDWAPGKPPPQPQPFTPIENVTSPEREVPVEDKVEGQPAQTSVSTNTVGEQSAQGIQSILQLPKTPSLEKPIFTPDLGMASAARKGILSQQNRDPAAEAAALRAEAVGFLDDPETKAKRQEMIDARKAFDERRYDPERVRRERLTRGLLGAGGATSGHGALGGFGRASLAYGDKMQEAESKAFTKRQEQLEALLAKSDTIRSDAWEAGETARSDAEAAIKAATTDARAWRNQDEALKSAAQGRRDTAFENDRKYALESMEAEANIRLREASNETERNKVALDLQARNLKEFATWQEYVDAIIEAAIDPLRMQLQSDLSNTERVRILDAIRAREAGIRQKYSETTQAFEQFDAGLRKRLGQPEPVSMSSGRMQQFKFKPVPSS